MQNAHCKSGCVTYSGSYGIKIFNVHIADLLPNIEHAENQHVMFFCKSKNMYDVRNLLNVAVNYVVLHSDVHFVSSFYTSMNWRWGRPFHFERVKIASLVFNAGKTIKNKKNVLRCALKEKRNLQKSFLLLKKQINIKWVRKINTKISLLKTSHYY